MHGKIHNTEKIHENNIGLDADEFISHNVSPSYYHKIMNQLEPETHGLLFGWYGLLNDISFVFHLVYGILFSIFK